MIVSLQNSIDGLIQICREHDVKIPDSLVIDKKDYDLDGVLR